jgi:hypothetical protein
MSRGTGARVFGQSKERRFKISLGRYTRLPGHNLHFLGKCLWSSKDYQIREIHQYLLWQSSRLESYSGCQNISSGTTVILPPTTLSHLSVSPKILVQVEKKSLMSSQGTVLLNSLLDQRKSWTSQTRTLHIISWAGCLTSTLHCSSLTSTQTGSLSNWSQALALLLRLGSCLPI